MCKDRFSGYSLEVVEYKCLHLSGVGEVLYSAVRNECNAVHKSTYCKTKMLSQGDA